MNISEETKLAFEFKKHSVNLYITLSTGIIALGVTFIKDLLGGDVPDSSMFWLKASCCALTTCVFSGMVLNHQLTGILDQKRSATQVPISIRANNISFMSGVQFFAFIAAIVSIVAFASGATKPKVIKTEFVWVAESTSNANDLGVYDSRNACIEAIKEDAYRCKIVKR